MQSMDELLPVDLIILGDLWHFLISEAFANCCSRKNVVHVHEPCTKLSFTDPLD